MSKMTTCSKCGGSGVLDYCGRCNGSGTVSCSTCGGSGEIGDNCRACGGSGRISRTRLKNCSKCHGTGVYQWASGHKTPCEGCSGSGQVEDRYDDICPNCNGVGHTSTRECSTCNGTGKITCPNCNGTDAHKPSTCNRCGGTGKVEVSSSGEGGLIQGILKLILGLLALIVLCWGGWRGYKWLKEGSGTTRAQVSSSVRNEATVRTKADAAAKAKAATGAAKAAAEGVGGEQQNGTRRKASVDSKGIRIVVHGKGKTKEAAVRWALRDAVFKTVGTWVDSKARIQENRDKVVAQVKTITEADVPKFEIMETQEQDGGFVVKVRVSVSKKKIAPKFAEIFPDVFANE